MLFYLECKMNLLIYGVGSKRNLLQQFLTTHVYPSFTSILVRGYHSGLMPKAILQEIAQLYMKNRKGAVRKFTSTGEIIEYIKRTQIEFASRDEVEQPKVVIFIHSMDIGVLKGQEWQEMLGELATCPLTRFVISVDNIKSGVLFTDQLLDQFSFVCF